MQHEIFGAEWQHALKEPMLQYKQHALIELMLQYKQYALFYSNRASFERIF